MRKVLLVLTLVGALAVPAVAAGARPPQPNMVVDPGGGGGSGYTGCSQVRASHSAGLPYAVTVNHYLVVSFCKQNGIITSLGIAAHGCDVTGIAFCNPTSAWLNGGGIGSSSASFEAHAQWGLTIVSFYNNSDTLHLTVQPG